MMHNLISWSSLSLSQKEKIKTTKMLLGIFVPIYPEVKRKKKLYQQKHTPCFFFSLSASFPSCIVQRGQKKRRMRMTKSKMHVGEERGRVFFWIHKWKSKKNKRKKKNKKKLRLWGIKPQSKRNTHFLTVLFQLPSFLLSHNREKKSRQKATRKPQQRTRIANGPSSEFTF